MENTTIEAKNYERLLLPSRRRLRPLVFKSATCGSTWLSSLKARPPSMNPFNAQNSSGWLIASDIQCDSNAADGSKGQVRLLVNSLAEALKNRRSKMDK